MTTCLLIYSLIVTILLFIAMVPPTKSWVFHNVLCNVAPTSRNFISENFVYRGHQSQMLAHLISSGFFEFVHKRNSNSNNNASQVTTASDIAAHLNLSHDVQFVHVCLQNLIQMHMIEKPGILEGSKALGDAPVRLSKVAKSHLLRGTPTSFVDEILRAARLQSLAAEQMNFRFKKQQQQQQPQKGNSSSTLSSLEEIFATTSSTAALEAGAEIENEMWKQKFFPFQQLDFQEKDATAAAAAAADSSSAVGTQTYRVLEFGARSGLAGVSFVKLLARTIEDKGPLFFVEPHLSFCNRRDILEGYTKKIVSTRGLDPDRVNYVEVPSIFDTTSSALQNGTFDLVILHEVLSLHSRREGSTAIVANAFGALKPGGWLAVADVIAREPAEYLPSLLDLTMSQPVLHNLMLQSSSGSSGGGESANAAASVPSMWQLHKLLRDAGFVDLESKNAYPKPFTLVLAKKPLV